jgi:hypothetical protein
MRDLDTDPREIKRFSNDRLPPPADAELTPVKYRNAVFFWTKRSTKSVVERDPAHNSWRSIGDLIRGLVCAGGPR